MSSPAWRALTPSERIERLSMRVTHRPKVRPFLALSNAELLAVCDRSRDGLGDARLARDFNVSVESVERALALPAAYVAGLRT